MKITFEENVAIAALENLRNYKRLSKSSVDSYMKMVNILADSMKMLFYANEILSTVPCKKVVITEQFYNYNRGVKNVSILVVTISEDGEYSIFKAVLWISYTKRITITHLF